MAAFALRTPAALRRRRIRVVAVRWSCLHSLRLQSLNDNFCGGERHVVSTSEPLFAFNSDAPVFIPKLADVGIGDIETDEEGDLNQTAQPRSLLAARDVGDLEPLAFTPVPGDVVSEDIESNEQGDPTIG